jgi:hypothetical protein
MGSFIVQHEGKLRGAVITERVLIGRKAFNAIRIDHRRVSRLHAWIKPTPDGDMLIDSGSRNGTRVNGNGIDRPIILRNGDHIEIGPALITYRSDGWLPSNVQRIDIKSVPTVDDDEGILFHCECGSPLWVKRDLAGARGRCRHCGNILLVPALPKPVIPITEPPAAVAPAPVTARTTPVKPHPTRVTEVPPPAPAPQPAPASPKPAQGALCSICQCPILPGEETHHCTECEHDYHADCWEENKGCASYGCTQVGALEVRQEPQQAGFDASVGDYDVAVPRDYLLLGFAVGSMVVGLFSFGAPGLLVFIAGIVYLRKKPPGRSPRITYIAMAIAVAAILVGFAASYVWWFGMPDLDLLRTMP